MRVEFHDVVMSRRMVRDFDPAPLPPGLLERGLREAVRSPSAGFSQGWDAVVLVEEPDRALFWESATAPEALRAPDAWLTGVRRAPALVVLCSDPQAYVDRYGLPDKAATGLGAGADAWPVPYWDVDTGMAAMVLLLSAADQGVGGLFFGVPGPRHEPVRAALGVPPGRRLVGVVALGRPRSGAQPTGARAGTRGGRGHRPGRRPLGQVVHRGRFGRTR